MRQRRPSGNRKAGKFGQPFNIENKTGAGGTLGAGELAKSAPDGHPLLISTSTALWQAKVLFKKLPYTPVKDFDPIALFPSGALPVAVNANVPAKTLRELITFAKGSPTAWSTCGAGSWAHMLGDVLNKSEKLSMALAHYRGEAPMLVDLIGGQIQVGVGSVQGVMPHIQSGKLRAIGATGKVRTPRPPDQTTLVEQGFTAPVFGIPNLPMADPAEVRKTWADDSAECQGGGGGVVRRHHQEDHVVDHLVVAEALAVLATRVAQLAEQVRPLGGALLGQLGPHQRHQEAARPHPAPRATCRMAAPACRSAPARPPPCR